MSDTDKVPVDNTTCQPEMDQGEQNAAARLQHLPGGTGQEQQQQQHAVHATAQLSPDQQAFALKMKELEIREMEISQERERQSLERDKIQAQLEMLRLQQQQPVASSPTQPVSTSAAASYDGFHNSPIQKFKEGEDVDVYLRTFEKLARVYQWPESTWATRLAEKLSGKARDAFANMAVEDSDDYHKVKIAILKRYQLTGEAYRQKFRKTKRKEEPFREFCEIGRAHV